MKRTFLVLSLFFTLFSCREIDVENPIIEDPTPGRLVAPTAKIEPAENITRTSAQLVGQITANENGTTAYFEYRMAGELAYTSLKMKGTYSGTKPIKVIATIEGLLPGTEYRYRLRPSNQGGGIASAEAIFKTKD